MRILTIAAALSLLAIPAQAVEIGMLMPGLAGPGIMKLAEQWKAQTGNSVVLVGGNAPTVGAVESTVFHGGGGADLVLLPGSEFGTLTGAVDHNTRKLVGYIVFGLAVKTGAKHPDISTGPKFVAAVQGHSVAYNDPASGSMAGRMVDALMKKPEYAGVKAMPVKGQGGQSVGAGEADMAVAVESEEVTNTGIDIVGPVPKAVGLDIDLSGAVLAGAAHPKEAAAFLAFITRPQAAAILKPTGIVAP